MSPDVSVMPGAQTPEDNVPAAEGVEPGENRLDESGRMLYILYFYTFSNHVHPETDTIMATVVSIAPYLNGDISQSPFAPRPPRMRPPARCRGCFNRCRLREGAVGICQVKRNIGGVITWSRPSIVLLTPIEQKTISFNGDQ